jgi:predicted nucleic acid-binding protein
VKLLDTTFLAHYYRGNDRVKAFLSERETGVGDAEDLVTTTINLQEIAVGLHVIGEDPSTAQFRSELGWLQIVPFEPAHAVEAADLEAQLHADESINQDRINSLGGGLLIAGAAEALDATVVTDNVADFETLGVAVESY